VASVTSPRRATIAHLLDKSPVVIVICKKLNLAANRNQYPRMGVLDYAQTTLTDFFGGEECILETQESYEL
jgi:predicted transcriptional regulator